MEPTRAAISAIHNNLKGDLLSLLESEGPLDPEEAQLKFANLTNTAYWEALYTLANAIDSK